MEPLDNKKNVIYKQQKRENDSSSYPNPLEGSIRSRKEDCFDQSFTISKKRRGARGHPFFSPLSGLKKLVVSPLTKISKDTDCTQERIQFTKGRSKPICKIKIHNSNSVNFGDKYYESVVKKN